MSTPTPTDRISFAHAGPREVTWLVGRPILRILLLILVLLATPLQGHQEYFHVRVIDSETKRGVPLVTLTTVNGISFVSDSLGNIAINEPDLMDQKIYFHVKSHGYKYPKDGFGYRGVRLDVRAGQTTTIQVQRINLAERLYRITGTGRYRDSRLLGLPIPLDAPAVNARVGGSDSVVTAEYRGQLYWFWGDTNRLSYPLGNFQVTGAVSPPPHRIDPESGIALSYFTDGKTGFARQIAPIEGPGPTWIYGAFVIKDPSGQERLVAKYEKIKPPMVAYKRGLVIFDDERQQFLPWKSFDMKSPAFPRGHAFRVKSQGKDYIHFATPFPYTRVEADFAKIQSPANYETYTCFKPGVTSVRNELGKLELHRDLIEWDKNGRPVYGWKKNTQPISPNIEKALVDKGWLAADQARSLIRVHPKNSEGKKTIQLASGSVAWNPYRKRWIMIAVQSWGSSLLGEIWYAESEQLEGPWASAIKIVTHDNYSFYNPRHHPYFDQENGRILYFEGTYTRSFSGTKIPTPRYDYNQIMYRLDLKRLAKPPG